MEHDAEQYLRRIYKKIGSRNKDVESRFILRCLRDYTLKGQMLALDLAVLYDDASYLKDVDISSVDSSLLDGKYHLFDIWMQAKTVNGLEDHSFSYTVTDYLFEDYITNKNNNVFSVVKGMSLLHNINTYIATEYPSLIIKHWDFVSKLANALAPYPYFKVEYIELLCKSLSSTQIYYVISKLSEQENAVLLTTCLKNQNKAITLDIFDFNELYQPEDCSIGGFRWDYTDDGLISIVESPNIHVPFLGCSGLLNRLYTLSNTRDIYMANIGSIRCLTAGMYAYTMACNTADYYTCEEMRIPTLISDIITWFRACDYDKIASYKQIEDIIQLSSGMGATPEEFSRLLALKIGLLKEEDTIELPAFD